MGERREEKRMDEKKKRKEERRQKELKAAARFSLKHDSDGEGAPVDFKDFGKSEKSRVRKGSESESDSDGEREKRREREREERKKKKSPLDMMMDKKRENEGGMKDRGRDRDIVKKEDKKPKYYRDIKPVKILGVTTEPGDLHFYVEWDSGMEPGLVSKKEAYKKIPDMCLAYYESKLIWRDAPPKPVKEEGEISNGVNNVSLGETKREEGVKTEASEKAKVVENGGNDGAPNPTTRAPTPVLHSYS